MKGMTLKYTPVFVNDLHVVKFKKYLSKTIINYYKILLLEIIVKNKILLYTNMENY